jgi:hypothetical protein
LACLAFASGCTTPNGDSSDASAASGSSGIDPVAGPTSANSGNRSSGAGTTAAGSSAAGTASSAAHQSGEAAGTQGAGAPAAPVGPTATLVGTALEAASGQRLAGVVLHGPDGMQTRSDESGRFEFAGLPLGWRGPLIAEGPDGLRTELRLRPLGPGRLEVVLRLAEQ